MVDKPRVLFLAHSLGGGGAERVTVNLANHLAQHGWPVGVLPLQTGGHSYPVDPGVEIIGDAPQGGNTLIRGLRKLTYVGSAIRRFRPDVVVSLGAGFGYLTSPTIRARFKLVTQIATDPTYLLSKSRLARIAYRRAFAQSDRIIFQTRAALEYFDDDVRRKGIIISNPLRNGITHNSAPFSERTQEVVSFGRLVPQKRFDVLIAAFANLHARYPEFRLSIFGEGPLRANLQEQIDTLGITDVATLAGFRDDIHDRIRDSAIYALSSEVEGLPNAMLEAMAIGVASVCTDCRPGGARETIDEFKSGVLVRANDPEALADGMASLIEDPERADALIAAGEPLIDLLAGERIYAHWADVIAEVARR